MHPFPLWPVPAIQSLVCTALYMSPSSPYKEKAKSHSPCFSPWYSLRSSSRSGSMIHQQPGGLHHSSTVLHSGRVRTGILQELLRKRRTLCSAFSALVSRHCQGSLRPCCGEIFPVVDLVSGPELSNSSCCGFQISICVFRWLLKIKWNNCVLFIIAQDLASGV